MLARLRVMWCSWHEAISYEVPVHFEHVEQRKGCKSLLSRMYFLNGCFDVAVKLSETYIHLKSSYYDAGSHAVMQRCSQGLHFCFYSLVRLSSHKWALFFLQIVCYHLSSFFEFTKRTHFRLSNSFSWLLIADSSWGCWLLPCVTNVLLFQKVSIRIYTRTCLSTGRIIEK